MNEKERIEEYLNSVDVREAIKELEREHEMYGGVFKQFKLQEHLTKTT